MRSILKTFLFAPALALAAACGKEEPVDTSLNNDLSLAAQANPGMRMDSISTAERMNAGVGPSAAEANAYRAGAASVAAAAPVAAARRPAATRRSASSGTRSTTTSSGGTVAREPRVVIKKNTKRDAAIGAVAGGVIGAATSRDKVKGGLIGAAAGGILGGVIGNNVDIEKKRVP